MTVRPSRAWRWKRGFVGNISRRLESGKRIKSFHKSGKQCSRLLPGPPDYSNSQATSTISRKFGKSKADTPPLEDSVRKECSKGVQGRRCSSISDISFHSVHSFSRTHREGGCRSGYPSVQRSGTSPRSTRRFLRLVASDRVAFRLLCPVILSNLD